MPHPSKKDNPFYHGDDKRKRKQDRKREGQKYEPWEKRRNK